MSDKPRRECKACGAVGNMYGYIAHKPGCIVDKSRPDPGQAIDITKAHNFIVVSNYVRDPTYAPYCMRCAGLERMKLIEPFHWRHDCGAEHDERQVLT